jgi:hypothetical protein
MSRSDMRDDASRSIQGAARPSRHPSPTDAIKHDARQFLNTAEYEFRKVVGASRSAPAAQEPDQAPAREAAPRRKPEAPNLESGGE